MKRLWKRWRLVVALLLVGVLVGVVGCAWWRISSQEYQNRRMLAELIDGESPDWLDSRLMRLGLMPTSGALTPPQMTAAIEKLGVEDLPALLRALRHKEAIVHLPAGVVLSRIGGPAIGPLTEMLADRACQKRAAQALGRIGPDARAAVPGLLRLMKGSGHTARLIAAKALGDIGDAQQAVTLLIKDLDHPVEGICYMTAQCLGKIGPAAKAAVPKLAEVVGDPKRQESRNYAATALGKIGPGAAEAVGVLVAALQTGPWDLRVCAAGALAGIGVRTEEVLAALGSAATDENQVVASAARRALKQLEVGK